LTGARGSSKISSVKSAGGVVASRTLFAFVAPLADYHRREGLFILRSKGMEIRIVKTDTFRSPGRKINQDDDKIRIVIDMNINEIGRLRRVLLDNEIEIIRQEAKA
jgi:hypothetical protein